MEATIDLRAGDPMMNVILMAVVPGERNKGVNGMNRPSVLHKSRVFRFGNKGLLTVQSCRAEKTSEDRVSRAPRNSSFRILRACFRKRVHSDVVGSLLKDFQTE